MIHKILSYLDSNLLIKDYIYLNKSLYKIFNFKLTSIVKIKTDFLPKEKYTSQKTFTICKFILAEILEESKSKIKNLQNIKIKIKVKYPTRPESSRFTDYPYIELNIINKAKEEFLIARITLNNINNFERNSDSIEISVKDLGLVENQTEKVLRNKAYYANNSLFGSSCEISFPLKDLSVEEIQEGKHNGRKFIEFLKENYNENYVIQLLNRCYTNKLSEFKEVEMKFLFVDLNL